MPREYEVLRYFDKWGVFLKGYTDSFPVEEFDTYELAINEARRLEDNVYYSSVESSSESEEEGEEQNANLSDEDMWESSSSEGLNDIDDDFAPMMRPAPAGRGAEIHEKVGLMTKEVTVKDGGWCFNQKKN